MWARERPRLGQEAGHVLPAAVAHVAGRGQLAHARVHEGEPGAPGAPAPEALVRVLIRLLRMRNCSCHPRAPVVAQAPRPLQPGALLQGCVQEEIPAQRAPSSVPWKSFEAAA